MSMDYSFGNNEAEDRIVDVEVAKEEYVDLKESVEDNKEVKRVKLNERDVELIEKKGRGTTFREKLRYILNNY